jgi:hypothetical protein
MTRELDEILSGAEPAQEVTTTAEPATTESTPEPQTEAQPRGPDGKFAPKASDTDQVAQAAVESTTEPAEKPHGMVPQPALHAAREKARSEQERADVLERQLAELRGQVSVLSQQRQPQPTPVEPPKPIEIWDDPNKFVESALSPLQQDLAETRFFYSQQLAITRFGEDAITAAETALKEAIARGEINGETTSEQLRRSRDPVGDVVRWHQNSPAVKEQSLREQIRAELMAELGQQPAPAATTTPAAAPTVMPTNLAGARNVGSRSGPEWSGPQPIEDIFSRARPKAG